MELLFFILGMAVGVAAIYMSIRGIIEYSRSKVLRHVSGCRDARRDSSQQRDFHGDESN